MTTALLYLLVVIAALYVFAKVAQLAIKLAIVAALAAAFYFLVYPEITALF